jgi:hypothetical protein
MIRFFTTTLRTVTLFTFIISVVFTLPISGKTKRVHLAFDPGKQIEPSDFNLESKWQNQLIKILPMTDGRQLTDRKIIGFCKDKPGCTYSTPENVSEWATKMFSFLLLKTGLSLVDTG